MTLNNEVKTKWFASGDSGEWKDTDKCRCGKYGPYTLHDGTNYIKLESDPKYADGQFPHLFKFEVKESHLT